MTSAAHSFASGENNLRVRGCKLREPFLYTHVFDGGTFGHFDFRKSYNTRAGIETLLRSARLAAGLVRGETSASI